MLRTESHTDRDAETLAAEAPPDAIASEIRPALATDVSLVGAMEGMGFETRQWLVERGGRFIQLSELLYRVVEQVNGERTIEEIAAAVATATERPVSANNIRYLIETRFTPLGLLAPASAAEGKATSPMKAKAGGAATRMPLLMTFKIGMIGPRPVEVFARFLQYLFWPPVLVAFVLAAAVGQIWLFFAHGILPTFYSALAHPLELVGAGAFVFASAIFHEFGHASALRYGGGRARGMGFGLYITYPAFYTDCTEGYRLNRWARLRTDLGGIYFDLITTVLLIALYTVTHQELLLVTVVLLDLEIADQFNPTMRFDGYWALADLVGVPDFFVLMGPVVRGALPRWLMRGRGKRQAVPPLKGWVKAVFLAYTVVTIPVLLFFFASLLVLAPVLLVTYWNSLVGQYFDWEVARAHGDLFGSWLAVAEALILVFSAIFLSIAVSGMVRSLAKGVWKLGHATPRRRAAAWLLTAVAAVFFVIFWVPQLAAIGAEIGRIAALARGDNDAAGASPQRPQPALVPTPGASAYALLSPEGHVVQVMPAPTPTATPAPPVVSLPATKPVVSHSGNSGGGRGAPMVSAQPNASQPQPKADPPAKPDPGTQRATNPQPKADPQPKLPPGPRPRSNPLPVIVPRPTIPPLPSVPKLPIQLPKIPTPPTEQ